MQILSDSQPSSLRIGDIAVRDSGELALILSFSENHEWVLIFHNSVQKWVPIIKLQQLDI
jgi:hypothetical protein